MQIAGNLPPETWNRLGTKVLPKLRSGTDLNIRIEFQVNITNEHAVNFETEIHQILADLDLDNSISIE